MSSADELLMLVRANMSIDEDVLLTELFKSTGEDFALPQDAVRKGYEALQAYIDALRVKICNSDTRIFLKEDFEKSGPVLVSLMIADTYLSTMKLPIQASIGALILKLGIDRVCAG